MTTLIVGIGNPLRRDDGAGPAVVEPFSCRKRVVHQLLPEHAAELAECDRVVFVDSAVDEVEVRLRPLLPGAVSPLLGHTGDPAWLLRCCEQVYGHVPEAWLLTIPAHDLGFGEGFSEPTRQAIDIAVEILEQWLSKSAAAVPLSALR